MASLLSAFRHITVLQLEHYRSGDWPFKSKNNVPPALFASLQHFKQLRSLVVGGFQSVAVNSFAAALNSLPAFTNLELTACERSDTTELTAALHHLCSTQLDHLTCSRRHLQSIVVYGSHPTPMRRLRSLTVYPTTPIPGRGSGPSGSPIHSSWMDHLPSLLHLTVSCDKLQKQLVATEPRQLSSFTVHGLTDADLSHFHTCTFRLCWSGSDRWNDIKLECNALERIPRKIQQLALSRITDGTHSFARSYSAFKPAETKPDVLSHLSYLEFVDDLAFVDLAYLLAVRSPPTFAAQLTHLALRVHWQDRLKAAALLPSLPSMYPSLIHVHISMQPRPQRGRVDECVEWDAAIQAVRAAMGSAWCASVDDVMAWREDVVWRRGAGLSGQPSSPYSV